MKLPFIPHDDPRVVDSTGALELDGIPKRMLVLGGGIIGLEMATVYDALGSKVTVVELMDQIIPGADKDIVKPLHKRIEKRCAAIRLKTKVTDVEAQKKGLKVTFEDAKGETSTDTFDRVLVVGRAASERQADRRRQGRRRRRRARLHRRRPAERTGVGHIFAIGDVVGQPMLAHKAVHEGKVAAEVAAGHKRAFDARVIPSVAYTDPEVAWVGVTEERGQEAEGIKYAKGVFPWAASGRSLANGRNEGITKLLFDPDGRPGDRRRHRRHQRRRPDRRGGAGDRDGRRRGRPRPHHPPAPDAVGDGELRRRDVRGHDHRPDAAEETLKRFRSCRADCCAPTAFRSAAASPAASR